MKMSMNMIGDDPRVLVAHDDLLDAIRVVAEAARELNDNIDGTRAQAEDLDTLRAALRGWTTASDKMLSAIYAAGREARPLAPPVDAPTKEALAAAGAFLTVLCAPHDPPACFTPKSEAHALGVNAALPIRKLLGFIAGKKLLELRDLVHAARDAAGLAGEEGRPS